MTDESLILPRRGLLRAGGLGAGLMAAGGFHPSALLHAQPAPGSRTLTIALPNNPLTIDPINQLNHDAMVLGQTVFENLVEYDVDGVLKPQLAKALPTVSADKLTYTFNLRDDVRFQNGQKMTAADVKYSFDYLLNPENRAARRSIFARIAEVTAVSEDTVTVRLTEPYQPWLYFLTKYMGIFPAGSRQQHGDPYFRSSPIGVGTGFGIFEEWKANDFISFRRNPNYWRSGVPRWDRLVVRIIPEDATRVAYLMTGQVDLISAPPPRDFARLKAAPGITGDSRPTLGGALLLYSNTQKPPLDDVNFRKAISCAIDRRNIGERVYQGLLEPSAIPAPPRGWWFNAEAEGELSFNLDRARRYLAASKYPNGAELDLLVQTEAYLLDTKDAAVVIQSQLARLGIRVNMRVFETSVLLQQVIRGEHTMALQMFMSPGEPSYIIQTLLTPDQVLSKSSNYNNPELNALIREAYAENEEDKLKAIWSRVQAVIARDAAMLTVGYVHASNLWRQNVRGFKVSTGLTINVAEAGV